ncbi:MAG: penicillin-insensitive murein endopeptidase [Oscillatoriaceae cyanobacterium Prado104]|jgi:peptidoglycan hydrolase-like protein with peptidoglycan-binding domain|nr:penicillin-insensitive murein endopeptidase [Oscillatoriaceae cyanobacterium Prado104]
MTAVEPTGFGFLEQEVTCTADIGLTEAEIEESSWGSRGIFAQMPSAGSGFECYGVVEKRFGRLEVIQALRHVCSQWVQAFPNGPRIGIGNISFAEGGPMPPHVSHQQGVDVDIAPVANTDEEIPLTWDHPKYSRQRTQQLVDLLRSNPILDIRTILFNDPDIAGVEPWQGHDNHLHVSFFPSGISPESHSSDQQGDLRLVIPNMEGARVRKLQEDLVEVGISIEVDGIFGSDTDAAIRQFQQNQGLQVDGIAGIVTQAKLAQIIRGKRGTSKGSAISLQGLIEQNKFIPFDDLNSGLLVEDMDLCREIQTILRADGFLDVVDGLYGPMTREALRRFKASRQLGGGDVLGPTTVKALLDAKPGSGILPDWPGGDKKAAIQAIIKEARRQGITNKSQIAYILATVQHETNDSFQPVREAYFLGEPEAENYRKTLRYYPHYGRGYVQLTWDYNYREYSTLLGLDLINQPDLVMRPDISLFIVIDGMKRGVFTGVNLDDYIFAGLVDFYNARRIINGTDEAERIEQYAVSWQTNLA